MNLPFVEKDTSIMQKYSSPHSAWWVQFFPPLCLVGPVFLPTVLGSSSQDEVICRSSSTSYTIITHVVIFVSHRWFAMHSMSACQGSSAFPIFSDSFKVHGSPMDTIVQWILWNRNCSPLCVFKCVLKWLAIAYHLVYSSGYNRVQGGKSASVRYNGVGTAS